MTDRWELLAIERDTVYAALRANNAGHGSHPDTCALIDVVQWFQQWEPEAWHRFLAAHDIAQPALPPGAAAHRGNR